MPKHTITTTASIPAPAAKIYAVIADYQNGHPHILPEPYFVSLTVEQGGVGAGTVIRFQMRLLGRPQNFRATISEPEPGRRLVETNDDGVVTTFLVEPQGGSSQVTITTEMDIPGGLPGAIQGWLMTRLLRPVYIKELEKLSAFLLK
jgi:hypothetical protein